MARRRRPRAVEGMALWPGAGSASDHPGLVAIEDGVAPLPVARLDFPYRREGRRAPDRAPKLMASIRDEVATLCERWRTTSEHLVLGGRSMGGRMCSMVAAGADDQDPLPVAGLVLMSYPLHPPGKPDKLRTEHFAALDLPCLFVSGTKDPFGSPEELEAHAAAIPGPVTFVWLPGGHDPRNADDAIADAVAQWLTTLG